MLRAHCEQAGRDPAEIHVSNQALLYLSDGQQSLDDQRPARPWQPMIAGTPGEMVDIVAQYRDAGADELIIPDLTLGTAARRKDTCELFMQEVASAFR